jgi:hypothetical protein
MGAKTPGFFADALVAERGMIASIAKPMHTAVMLPYGFPLNDVSATQVTTRGTIQETGEWIWFLRVALNRSALDSCTLSGSPVALDSMR